MPSSRSESATRITALEAREAELVGAVARLTTFVEALADNDLDEPIADNGMTVGAKLQYDAPSLVLYARATLANPMKGNDMTVDELRNVLAKMPGEMPVYNVEGHGIASAQHTIKGNLIGFDQHCELRTYYENHSPNHTDGLIERETGFQDRKELIAAYKALKAKEPTP